jgi:hypothetical protein
MALVKSNLNLPFGQGLDTKTDPWQIAPGKMLELENGVFNTGFMLEKRNGFELLPAVDDDYLTTLATFNGTLVALGDSLSTFSGDTWQSKGAIRPVDTSVLAVQRRANSLDAQDAAVAPNGLCCVVSRQLTSGANIFFYQVVDSASSNIVSAPTTAIVGYSMRVFVLGDYFVIAYVTSAGTGLEYFTISIADPSVVSAAVSLSSTVDGIAAGWDGCVNDGYLYYAWEDTVDVAKINRMSSSFVQGTPVAVNPSGASEAPFVSVSADPIDLNAWLTFYDPTSGGTGQIYTAKFTAALSPIFDFVHVQASQLVDYEVRAITSAVRDDSFTAFVQLTNTTYTGPARFDMVKAYALYPSGTYSVLAAVSYQSGLASKPFYVDDRLYVAVAYGSPTNQAGAAAFPFQPTYFLMALSPTPTPGNLNPNPNIVAKLAYSNGGGYVATQVLPSVTVTDTVAQMSYLYKFLIEPVSKSQGAAAFRGVYGQLGVNLVSWDLDAAQMTHEEAAGSLHMTGGFLWQYDGLKPVELGFHLWPEDVTATWSAAGGAMAAQPDGTTNTNAYFYQVIYSWQDNTGLIHRSAPGIPIGVTTTGSGSTGSVTLQVPPLAFTSKGVPSGFGVEIEVYRWSVEQQVYYKLPVSGSNSISVEYVTIVDTSADATILGNEILYTTGGVVENIGPPACSDSALFDSRLWLIPSEEEDVLAFSKALVQGAPVEMSDLFTIFAAPTSGSQGSTGRNRVLAPMDDKLIVFKDTGIYYITGSGPDNTGANNNYSPPIYIASTVGCDNPHSVILIPPGLIFQSNKGIWLLGRDLSTNYIGADVAQYENLRVLSAITVPNTNQVRLKLEGGIVLMYDYYYKQWGTFVNNGGLSSIVYDDVEAYLSEDNEVFKETPAVYVDDTEAVTMKFKTGWFSFAGLQGLERAYFFYFLGRYLSPHQLLVEIAYDYNDATVQSTTITPDSEESVEQWRVFLERQKCQSFRLTITELYDATLGAPGAGLTLSGLNLVVGAKRSYNTLNPARSAG